MKVRIRKKGKDFVVEKFENKKWISRTLDAGTIWNHLVSNNPKQIVSKSQGKIVPFGSMEYAQSSLTELGIKRKVAIVFGKWGCNTDFVLEPACENDESEGIETLWIQEIKK